MMRIVLFCAIELEYRALRALVCVDGEVEDSSGYICERARLSIGDDRYDLYLCETGYGVTATALSVQRVLQFLRPDVAIFLGIAGAIKDASIGDVVIADRVYFYEHRKEAKSVASRPDVVPANDRLLQLAKSVSRAWNGEAELPTVYVKPIATGNALIADSKAETIRYIKDHYNDAVAIEMEGSGFMTAAFHSEIPAILFRGISDKLSGKELADKLGSQQKAAHSVARFAVDYVARINPSKFANITNKNVNVYSFEDLEPAINRLQRRIESAFNIDCVITMSGPGSFVALNMHSKRIKSVPLLVAITFPKSQMKQEDLTENLSLFDENHFIHIYTRKWIILIPDIFRMMRKNACILIIDDRINDGNSQVALQKILRDRGFNQVYRAALFVDPTNAKGMQSVDFYEMEESSEYYTPWGSRHGRS